MKKLVCGTGNALVIYVYIHVPMVLRKFLSKNMHFLCLDRLFKDFV